MDRQSPASSPSRSRRPIAPASRRRAARWLAVALAAVIGRLALGTDTPPTPRGSAPPAAESPPEETSAASSATEQAATREATTAKAATREAATERASTERASTERASTERAATGQAGPGKAAPQTSASGEAVGRMPSPSAEPRLAQSQPEAVALLRQVIAQLAHGPAFDAKVRERVWTSGREVVGVGTYEQAGEGTGRFNLQITMHDGDGKHTLQQISDGRLAWTRTQIADEISLSRVDVGRLDEWVRQSGKADRRVAPRLRVGAWTEMLDRIGHDYVLRLSAGTLQSPGGTGDSAPQRPVWILSGQLRQDVRAQTQRRSGRDRWPSLYPTKVRVAIASTPDEVTGFGKGLPVYLEFWSDPRAAVGSEHGEAAARRSGQRHLISLIELYSVRPIEPPPVARFRFDNQDVQVNFVNETDRYLKRYGLQMTRSQQRELLR